MAAEGQMCTDVCDFHSVFKVDVGLNWLAWEPLQIPKLVPNIEMRLLPEEAELQATQELTTGASKDIALLKLPTCI